MEKYFFKFGPLVFQQKESQKYSVTLIFLTFHCLNNLFQCNYSHSRSEKVTVTKYQLFYADIAPTEQLLLLHQPFEKNRNDQVSGIEPIQQQRNITCMEARLIVYQGTRSQFLGYIADRFPILKGIYLLQLWKK